MRFIKLCALLALVSISLAQEKPDKNELGDYLFMKITPKVTEENGEPIKAAEIHVAVGVPFQYKDGYNDFLGKSDEQGLFAVESMIQTNVKIEVRKSGYYLSKTLYAPQNSQHLKSGEKIQPWNPTVPIILKKIGKPVPMIVRLGLANSERSYRAPRLGEEVGFDMNKADWVQPNGKGEIADFLVRFDSEFLSPESYKTDATIRFFNPDDGLLPITELIGEESELKYPRVAPEDGFEVKSLRVKSPIYEARSEAKEKQPLGYLFRIRTVRDKATNKITSAQYGKIVGRPNVQENSNPFEFNTVNRNEKRELVLEPSFSFSSYLNPTPNDRNLEYDQQNNLAPEADKGVTLAP
jgi:hypothetical protein